MMSISGSCAHPLLSNNQNAGTHMPVGSFIFASKNP